MNWGNKKQYNRANK